MKLTPAQILTLQRLKHYREQAPALGERLRLASSVMLLLAVAFALVISVAVWLQVPSALPLVLGAFIGAIAAEIGHQRRYINWWPLNREITDWQKVDQLLSGTAEVPRLAPPAAGVQQPRVARAAVVGISAFVVIFVATLAADRALAYAHDPTRNNPPDGVILLTASWCGYCMSLREHLAEAHVHYTELDVEKTTEGGWAFTAVRGTGVPITIVGKEVIRGAKWDKLDAALKNAGYRLPPAQHTYETDGISAQTSPESLTATAETPLRP
jgi:glutaredoxin